MPTEITAALDAIQRALTAIPGALVVIVLLGGPTAVWIVYRAVMAAQRGRYLADHEQPMWICGSCRSANTLKDDRCYRCGRDAGDVEALQFIGRDGVVTLADAGSPGVAVGPGRGTAAPPVTASSGAEGTRRVAVGPGKPTPRPPRKAVVADRPRERATDAEPERPTVPSRSRARTRDR